MDERLMAEFACLDPVFAHGIAGIANMGTDFATYFFRWQVVKMENGVLVRERMPAMPPLIRPRASIQCRNTACSFWSTLDQQGQPTDYVISLMRH